MGIQDSSSTSGRKTILEELHETHPGCSKMKSLARSYVWWPNLDEDFVTMVKLCCVHVCQEHRASPARAPLQSWNGQSTKFCYLTFNSLKSNY